MNALTTLMRVAALGLSVAAFTGTALADPGNGNGGPATTPPGQEKKAEEPAAVPAAATPAPAPRATAAPGQEKKAVKQAAKTVKKAESKPAAAAAKGQAKKPETSASKGRSAEAHHHVIICHRTGSDSNPYVVINIPWTAWSEAHSPDTGSHPDLNGRHDILLKDPASRPGSKDGFTKDACGSPAPAVQPTAVCPKSEQHKQDDKGTCATQQPQPADACPNVAGMQTTIPTGLVKDAQGNCVTPTAAVAAAPAPPAGEVAGAVSPAAPKKQKVAAAPAKAKPAGGVLGAVATAPEAIAETAASGELPFTGIPLWIAALLGGGLLATGLVLRRASATR